MNKSILIIDDQESQAQELCDALQKALNDCCLCYASEESDIMAKIITRYYSVAIVDLRMEHHNIDGFTVMDQIMIANPVRDKASNEIDLIVRNDLNDAFFSKFGRYLFVECKNRPELGFNKNDFIVFNKKVSSSNGDSNLGVVFTTGHIKRSVYLEALRESEKGIKILYLGSGEIMRLIHTPNMLDEFKEIIDRQVA